MTKTAKKAKNMIEAVSALHFISDIGCEHVELRDGRWLPLEALAALIEADLTCRGVRTFADDRSAVAAAHSHKGHVYPINGRTIMRLIIAGKVAPNGVAWSDIDGDLKAGRVDGVPAGTDLEEFLWQTRPDSRTEIEARNPGRKFMSVAWAKKHKV